MQVTHYSLTIHSLSIVAAAAPPCQNGRQPSSQFVALSGIKKMFGQYGIASGHSSDIQTLFPEMVTHPPNIQTCS